MSLEDACTFIFTNCGLIYLADKKEIILCLKLASPQVSSQYCWVHLLSLCEECVSPSLAFRVISNTRAKQLPAETSGVL